MYICRICKALHEHTCCLVWAFWTYSRPTLMRGVRMARLNSSTLMPSRWQSFCAAVSSGIEAWSVFFSLWNEMFPNCSTAEITFNIAEKRERVRDQDGQQDRKSCLIQVQCFMKSCGCFLLDLFETLFSLTCGFLWGEAHDGHWIHCLSEVFWIALTRNRKWPPADEAVLIRAAQQKLLYRKGVNR